MQHSGVDGVECFCGPRCVHVLLLQQSDYFYRNGHVYLIDMSVWIM